MKKIKFNSSKLIILFFVAFIIVGAANVLFSDRKMNTSEYLLSENQKDVVSRSETQPKIPFGALVNSKLKDNGSISLTAKIKYQGEEKEEIKVVEDALLDYQITNQENDQVIIPYSSQVPSTEKRVSKDDIIEGDTLTTEQLKTGVYQIEVKVPIILKDKEEVFVFRIPVEL
ncbi:hypothetical protein [Guptibacillus hwajinpoensis]|uniref:Uncharacterized protein n=1 Tax=Guptibacillus hwajinpoensis TaxID=208199 RepID=A0A0J6D0X1_9BACL|nr:hypothetical protein [Alkalihalobacillus macyae]KMM38963.1 hypothetical protein AB986_06855 [Alkalihalobacillus macyae]